jgi:hypothetical protein
MLAGRTAHAQQADLATFDLGGIAIQQRTFIDGNALTAAGLWLRTRDRWGLTATGAGSVGEDSRYTAMGILAGSLFGKPGRSRWELMGSGGILGTTDQEPAESWTLGARQHWQRPTHGGWAGLTRGGHAGEFTSQNLWVGDVAWWLRESPRQWLFSGTGTFTTKERFLYDDFQGLPQFALDPLEFADGSTSMRWITARADVDLLGGMRVRIRGDVPTTLFGALGVTWWMTPRVGLATSVGRQLDDPLRGTAEARYLVAAVRFSAHPARTFVRRRQVQGPVLEWKREGEPGMLTLSVRNVSAGKVELMGDFTDWQPLPMALEGQRWVARVRVATGPRQVMMRLDEGEWTPPPNVAATDDGFGGKVGLIVVP